MERMDDSQEGEKIDDCCRFPDFHYPAPITAGVKHSNRDFTARSAIEQRRIFDDYGSRGFLSLSTSVSEKGCVLEWKPQYPSVNCQFSSRCLSQPLTEPNSVNYPLSDVYCREIESKREKIAICHHSFKRQLHHIGNSSKTPNTEVLEKWLKSLRRFSSNRSYDVTPVLTQIPLHMKQLSQMNDLFVDVYIPTVNHRYTGGCLSHFNRNQKEYLIYCTGKDFDKIAVKSLNDDSSPRLQLADVDVMNFSESVTGLTYNSVQLNDYIFAKGSKKCALFKCDDDLRIKQLCERVFDDNVSSATLSPHIMGEAVVTTENRTIYFWEGDGRVKKLIDRFEPRFEIDEENWTQAHFSAHPRCICVADQSACVLMDIRTPKSDCTDLFVLPNDLLNVNERIVSANSLTRNPFYHLVNTDFTMTIVDERFPKHPVLLWKHPLRLPVQYIDYVRDVLPDDTLPDLLMVSSSLNNECLCYPISLNGTPRTDKIAWCTSPIDRFTQQVLTHGAKKMIVEKRVNNASLLGICGYKRPDNSIVAVQMSCYGDLFYQFIDIVENETDLGESKECLLDHDQIQHCSDWLERIHTQANNQWLINENMNFIEIDPTDSMSQLKDMNLPNVACQRCNGRPVSDTQHLPSQSFYDVNNSCPQCHLPVSIDSNVHPDVFRQKVMNYDLDDGAYLLRQAIGRRDPIGTSKITKTLIRLWNEREIIVDDDEENDDGQREEERTTEIAVDPDVNVSVAEGADLIHDTSMDLFSTQLDAGDNMNDGENVYDDFDAELRQSSQMNSSGWFNSNSELTLATNSQPFTPVSTSTQQQPKKRKRFTEGF